MIAHREFLRRALFVAALIGAFGLSSCSTFDLDHATSFSDATRQDEVAASLPPEQRKEHQRLVSSYGGIYRAPALEALISDTVNRLVQASERPDLQYRVVLLNSPAINAFALPSGTLYVTRGLVSLANDTSELSSVLSHEMAHVVARHAAIRDDQVRQAVLVSRVISDVLNDADLGALALARSRVTLATFSRAQELEADAVGVGIAARAGFDPFGASRFLTTMGRYAAMRGVAFGRDPAHSGPIDFLSSHPSTPERISIAVANARQYSVPGDGERDRKAFLEAMDGMVYGDDPKEGFVRGRRFFHPKLGFTFTAPDGFALENTPQAVLGATATGREALRLDTARVSALQSLESYLASGWIDGVDKESVESLVVNGFPAATAIARGSQWSFRLYAIRFGTDVYRLVFAARGLDPMTDQKFRDAATTFRRVPIDEANEARPLRIRMVQVARGDTVDKLARRMVVGDRALDRFLVLNGLTRNAALKPGDHVKIVVE
jgi:predicted Zn-dependent protease